MGIEKRKLERFALSIPASIRTMSEQNQRQFDLMTENICSGGAFLHSDQFIAVDTKVNVEIVIPIEKLKKINSKNTHISVDGIVVRREENGIAVCFENNYKIKRMDS